MSNIIYACKISRQASVFFDTSHIHFEIRNSSKQWKACQVCHGLQGPSQGLEGKANNPKLSQCYLCFLRAISRPFVR